MRCFDSFFLFFPLEFVMFIHKSPSQYRLFSADPPTAGARTQTWDDVLLFFACTFANYKHPNIGRYSMLNLNCRKFKTEVISIANHNSQCLQINEWGKIIKLSSSAGKRAQINQGWFWCTFNWLRKWRDFVVVVVAEEGGATSKCTKAAAPAL